MGSLLRIFSIVGLSALQLVSVLTVDTLKIFHILGIDKSENNKISIDDIDNIISFLSDYDMVCLNGVGPKTAREFHSILTKNKNNYIGLSPKDFAYKIYRQQGLEYLKFDASNRKEKDMAILKKLFGY